MRLSRTSIRLRIRAPRWPSTDHRDYQASGRRRPSADPAVDARARTQPARSHPPAVSRIIGLCRDDEMLHVELMATSERAVAGAAQATSAHGRVRSPGDMGPSFILTLTLN